MLEVAKKLGEGEYARLGEKLGLDEEDLDKIEHQFTEEHEKALVVMQVTTHR